MKKWWLWSLGTIGVLIVGFVAVAVLMPPAGQFSFLHGNRPIQVSMPERDRRQMEQMGMVFTIYSFKARFEEVKTRAQEELVADGYMDMGSMFGDTKSKVPQAAFVKGNIMAGFSSGGSSAPEMPEMNMVMIMADTRITETTPFSGAFDPTGKSKGWVSVVVVGKPSKTIFDRFRDWVGM